MAPRNKVDRSAAVLSIAVVVALMIAVSVILTIYRSWSGYEGSGRGLIQQVSAQTPLQPRPILFTDWEVERGRMLWVATGGEDSHLRLSLTPGDPWFAANLRPEVLENSEGYRELEMEIFSGPDGWKMSLFLYYEGHWDEEFWLSSDSANLNPRFTSLYDRTYLVVVAPEGRVTIRLPLATESHGALKRVDLTVFFGEVLIRSINLVP